MCKLEVIVYHFRIVSSGLLKCHQILGLVFSDFTRHFGVTIAEGQQRILYIFYIHVLLIKKFASLYR